MNQTFYFNTGVKRHINDYMAEGDIWNAHNERMIAFHCEGVPAGATFHSASENGDISEYNHLLVFPIIGGNLCSKFAYFNPPPKPKKKVDLVSQWFVLTLDGKTRYFETCTNGEGVYDQKHNTILGGLYDEWGAKIRIERINYSLLRPLNYSQIARIFEII